MDALEDGGEFCRRVRAQHAEQREHEFKEEITRSLGQKYFCPLLKEMSSLKDVLQTNQWSLRRGDGQKKATHLLLDGGRAHVPPGSEDQFLNEYVLVVARNNTTPPAVVELRTPVFKMFMDVDAKLPLHGNFDFAALWSSLYAASKDFFLEVPRMVVCTAPVKTEPEAVKYGAHIIWPTLFVTAETALAFRDKLIPLLREEFGEELFVNPWEDVIDACVYKANGLRMPWSVKKGESGRPYTPAMELTDAAGLQIIPEVTGVSVLRKWVHELSIRAHGKEVSPLQEGIVVPKSSPTKTGGSGGPGRNQSLDPFRHLLPIVEAALPPEYKPQTFAGLFRTPNMVVLRSSSKYCRSVGREHTSSTVFFVIQRGCEGITQRCFCRKESCTGYESEVFAVDREVVETFLGAAAAAGTCVASKISMEKVALPSQKSKSANNLHHLLGLGVKSRATKKRGKK